MTREPDGHRGHPSHGEEMQAAYMRQRLGACVIWLKSEGFSEEEAVAFVAGVAYEVATEDGESWAAPGNAIQTCSRLLEGAAAKYWSLRAIGRAIDTVSMLSDRGEA